LTGEPEIGETVPKSPVSGINPIAVASGRKGGLKGGKALAAKLTKAQRVASASKATAARQERAK